jgi:hypothetical protein
MQPVRLSAIQDTNDEISDAQNKETSFAEA